MRVVRGAAGAAGLDAQDAPARDLCDRGRLDLVSGLARERGLTGEGGWRSRGDDGELEAELALFFVAAPAKVAAPAASAASAATNMSTLRTG